MAVQQGEQGKAMYSATGEGPTFGEGYDLHIVDNCHPNIESYAQLGPTYQLPAAYKSYTATRQIK